MTGRVSGPLALALVLLSALPAVAQPWVDSTGRPVPEWVLTVPGGTRGIYCPDIYNLASTISGIINRWGFRGFSSVLQATHPPLADLKLSLGTGINSSETACDIAAECEHIVAVGM